MAAHVDRRGVLQAGALTGGLALAGAVPSAVRATSLLPDTPRLNGTIGEHIYLDPIRGAVIRLTQLDSGLHPVRELALVRMTVAELYDGGRPSSAGNPLRRVCNRANALALNVAAANWQVPPGQCLTDGGAIAHPQSGSRVGYARWVDIV